MSLKAASAEKVNFGGKSCDISKLKKTKKTKGEIDE